MVEILSDIKCPGCGARVSIEQNECEWCHTPLTITSFNSLFDMSKQEIDKYYKSFSEASSVNPDNNIINKTLGMCFIKMGLYDKALACFDKIIINNINDSEVYFYSAISLLEGKKPFVVSRKNIDKIVTYINVAINIENRGLYHYFLAFIKYDYFERKYLNTIPNYKECLIEANKLGVSEHDKVMLFDFLKVQKPSHI